VRSKISHQMQPFSAAIAVAIASLTFVPAGGTAAPSRIIDRTLVCKMSGVGYPDSVRFMTVGANQYQPSNRSSASINVNNRGAGDWGIGAHMRPGPRGEGSETTTGQLSLTRTATGRCANTRPRIPLSNRGLRPAPPDPFSTFFRCDVPAKVLIRVRAVFTRPTAFRVDPRFPDSEAAKGTITKGYLAVATLRGRRPLAFGSVGEASGPARLFVARSGCSRTG
jgi:hypothetical protein